MYCKDVMLMLSELEFSYTKQMRKRRPRRRKEAEKRCHEGSHTVGEHDLYSADASLFIDPQNVGTEERDKKKRKGS